MGRNARTRAMRKVLRLWEQKFPPDALYDDDDGYGEKLAEAIKAYPYPTSDGEPYVINGWGQMAMEYIALADRERTDLQEGMYLLFDGCLSFSMLDWYVSDYSPTAKENIRKAGEILNKVGGTYEMNRILDVWVPRELHRSIDNLWGGVGEWKA